MNYYDLVNKCNLISPFTAWGKCDQNKFALGCKTLWWDSKNPENELNVFGENIQEFDKKVDEIYKNKILNQFSKKEIENFIVKVLVSLHFTDKSTTKADNELRTTWENLLNREDIAYDVFTPIYGVEIDKITKIGNFTAYNYADFKNLMENNSASPEDALPSIFDEEAGNEFNYLKISVNAKSAQRATELAKPQFELFECVAKFLTSGMFGFSDSVDIGIFNYKKLNSHRISVVTQNGLVSKTTSFQGASTSVSISHLYQFPIFRKIWEILKKNIEKKSTEFENRLVNAIRWVSMAHSENSDAVRCVQYVFALESLLANNPKRDFITPSVAYQLAEYSAFIVGENITNNKIPKAEIRKRIFDDVKKMYSLRSSIVHGNGKDTAKEDLRLARNLIYQIIFAVVQNKSILSFTSMKELSDWIKELKFSS